MDQYSEPDVASCFEPQVIVRCEESDVVDYMFTESVWIKQEVCDKMEEENNDDNEDKFAQRKQDACETQTAIDDRFKNKYVVPAVGPSPLESVNIKQEFVENFNTVHVKTELEDQGAEKGEKNVKIKQGRINARFASTMKRKKRKLVKGAAPGGSSVATDPQQTAKMVDGRKTYCCPHCAYNTVKCSSMKDHLLTHSDYKPHACPDCAYSSFRASSLTRHMAIHSGDRPFRCGYCTHSCSQKQHLVSHIARRHSGPTSFQCEHCQYTTEVKYEMVSHLKVCTLILYNQ